MKLVGSVGFHRPLRCNDALIQVPSERVLSFDEKRLKSLIEPRFCKAKGAASEVGFQQFLVLEIMGPWVVCCQNQLLPF